MYDFTVISNTILNVDQEFYKEKICKRLILERLLLRKSTQGYLTKWFIKVKKSPSGDF